MLAVVFVVFVVVDCESKQLEGSTKIDDSRKPRNQNTHIRLRIVSVAKSSGGVAKQLFRRNSGAKRVAECAARLHARRLEFAQLFRILGLAVLAPEETSVASVRLNRIDVKQPKFTVVCDAKVIDFPKVTEIDKTRVRSFSFGGLSSAYQSHMKSDESAGKSPRSNSTNMSAPWRATRKASQGSAKLANASKDC